MNLLARSLSPSGQQASPVAPSSSRSKAKSVKSRHARPSNLSPSGYTQPHMLFQLEADPVQEVVSTPASPKSYPWSRFQRQKSATARPYYDSFASAQSPEGNFDYYEYFCNYGKLSSSASPITSPDEPWSRERTHAPEPRPRARNPTEPGTSSHPLSFRPSNISFRKLFRRPGPPSPSSPFAVTDGPVPDPLSPPLPGPAHYSQYHISSSSPPSPEHRGPFAPSHAVDPLPASKIKRYFSQPSDSGAHLVLPVNPYDSIHQHMPSLHNQQPYLSSYHMPPDPVRHYPDSPAVHRKWDDGMLDRALGPPRPHRSRDPSLGPLPDRYARVDGRQQSVIHTADPPERPEQADRSRRPSTTATGSLYRISFIETNAYVPQDVPTSSSSPEHMPPLHRLHQPLHGEW